MFRTHLPETPSGTRFFWRTLMPLSRSCGGVRLGAAAAEIINPYQLSQAGP